MHRSYHYIEYTPYFCLHHATLAYQYHFVVCLLHDARPEPRVQSPKGGSLAANEARQIVPIGSNPEREKDTAMSNALEDRVIAEMVASYEAAPPVNRERSKTPAKPKVTVTVTAPSPLIPQEERGVNPLRQGDNDQAANLPVLPLKGTIDARAFLKAMNRATDRASKMQAISAFIGYNVGEPYGPQEDRARFEARKAIHGVTPGTDRTVVRSAQASVKGYVAGMPDNHRKTVLDLVGREHLAASVMGDMNKIAQDEKRTEGERAAARQYIKREGERVSHIRSDLKRLGELEE